jgi:aerobic-type carbon monoxide dehydrogenase small subunit (CoxS/CutS family)
MDDLNLVVKFMLAGDAQLHVKGAARIKVDGRGGLLLYGAQGGAVETIELGAQKSFRLQQVRQVYTESAIPVLV